LIPLKKKIVEKKSPLNLAHDPMLWYIYIFLLRLRPILMTTTKKSITSPWTLETHDGRVSPFSDIIKINYSILIGESAEQLLMKVPVVSLNTQ